MKPDGTPHHQIARPGGDVVTALWHPHGCARWILERLAPLLLIAAYLALGVSASSRVGLTVDEPAHVGVGYVVLTTGDYRLDRIHPPLARMWLALPLTAMDLAPPRLRPEHLRIYQFWWPLRDWIQLDNPVQRTLLWPRRMNLLFGAALIAVVWLVLRRTDKLAALIAAALLAFSPHLLAHGSLATTDMALILLYPAAALAFWWASRCLHPARVLAAGVLLGAALLSKFSAIVLLPVCAVLVVVRLLCPAPVHWRIGRRLMLTTPASKAGAMAFCLIVVGLCGYAVIWAAYGFRYSAGPPGTTMWIKDVDGPYLNADAWHVEEWQSGPGLRLLYAARKYRLLPEAYINGLLIVMYKETQRLGFLIGYTSYEGWWYYFPLAFLLKTPISMLSALGAGCTLALGRWLRSRRHWPGGSGLGWPCLVAILLFAAVTMHSDVNIGLRHFLPVLPLLVLIAVPALARWARESRANLAFLATLILWQAGWAAWIWPDYLCSFNVLVGGPSRGYNYLVDSNLDWGQELPKLARYARAHGLKSLKLAYFGSAYPCTYGLANVQRLPDSSEYRGQVAAKLAPGTYVVSAHILQGMYTTLTRLWLPGHESRYRRLLDRAERNPNQLTSDDIAMLRSLSFHRLLCRLRERDPDDRVGYTLFVYDVSPKEFDEVIPPKDARIIRAVIE